MMIQLPRPKAWVSTLVLAGLGVLTSAMIAQAQNPHVNADAVMVSLDDEGYSDISQDISQVGFFEHEGPSCDSSCGGCGKSSKRCCCQPWWAHRCGGFGQFLLLRPGNVDQIYTIEQNTVVPGNDPTGPVGRLNIDEETAYRLGFSWAATEATSLVVSYTKFEGKTSNGIAASGTNVLNSQIIHPSTLTVGSASLQSGGNYSLDFELLDLSYRHLWKACDYYAINWLAGFQYGRMEQDLLVAQEIQVATGPIANLIDVDFDGFGMMFGIDGIRRSTHTGLLVYGKALSSFLAGDWKADYLQVNTLTGGGIVANNYEDYRVTPVVELELGLGWQSKCGRCTVKAGYMTSAWYDAVSTRQYVDAVRRTNYISVDETITFSGLTAGVEARF